MGKCLFFFVLFFGSCVFRVPYVCNPHWQQREQKQQELTAALAAQWLFLLFWGLGLYAPTPPRGINHVVILQLLAQGLDSEEVDWWPWQEVDGASGLAQAP